MPTDRHDHVATEWGAHMRGEQKITSRNTQDQSATAGRLGGGLNLPQDSGGLNAQDQSSTAGQFCGGVLLFTKALENLSKSRPLRNGPQRLLRKKAMSGIIYKQRNYQSTLMRNEHQRLP